jgi:hypothetical protein
LEAPPGAPEGVDQIRPPGHISRPPWWELSSASRRPAPAGVLSPRPRPWGWDAAEGSPTVTPAAIDRGPLWESRRPRRRTSRRPRRSGSRRTLDRNPSNSRPED